MKLKLNKKIITGALAAFMFVVAGSIVLSQTALAEGAFVAGDDITQSSSVDGPFFAAGMSIQVDDSINGDAYIAGQSVIIAGDITGDLIVAAQNLTISGNIEGDVRSFAQNTTITGKITGSLTTAGQILAITKDASVGKDVVSAAQTISSNGTIERDLYATAETINIGGTVGRNIQYISEYDLKRADSAQIGGKIERTDPPKQTYDDAPSATANILLVLYGFLTILIGTIIVGFLAPRVLRTSAEIKPTEAWQPTLRGLLALLITVPIFALLLITIVGIPFALIGLAGFALAVLLGLAISSYYIGSLAVKNKHWALQATAGAAIFTIISLIPIVDAIFGLIAISFGLGVVLSKAISYVKNQRQSVIKTKSSKKTK